MLVFIILTSKISKHDEKKNLSVLSSEKHELIKAFLQAVQSLASFPGTINFNITVASFSSSVPEQEEKPDNGKDHFPYLTKKCFEQKQVDAVEAEIQAAKTGTAEDMWRTLWDNENMGYLNVKHINATSLYHDIEKWYGKLPYKERNFRDARNKR